MKHLLFCFFATLLLASCRPDPPPPTPDSRGTLNVNFVANFNGSPLTINNLYNSAFGYRIKPETIRFLVHHIFVKSGSTETEVKDAYLVDFSSASNSFSVMLSPGSYDGVKFGLGVDTSLNHDDPSVLPASHAFSLNSANDMFWSWASGYIFFKYEGRADTSGTSSETPDRLFFFHAGKDTLYRTNTFYSSPFSISTGNTTNLYVDLDVNKLFVGATDTIDVKTDYATHTADNLPLAFRFVDLYMSAFSVH